MNIRIEDIMREPVLIGDGATFLDALKEMICRKTNALLVVNRQGKLVGKVQALDLMRQVKPAYLDSDTDAITAHFATEEILRQGCEEAKPIPVSAFMTRDPKTITPRSSLLEAVVVAIGSEQTRVPVVDGEGRPIGVLTRTELKQIMGVFAGIEECFAGAPLRSAAARDVSGPLTAFFLPIDPSDAGKRVVKFSGCLASGLGDRVAVVTLFHVTEAGFLQKQLAAASQRRVKSGVEERELFQRSRQEYIANTVTPMFAEAEALLKGVGVRAPVDTRIVDGDPAKEILKAAEEGGYSTIVMGRRGLSPIKQIFLGSVTSSLLHAPVRQSVYVVGDRVRDADTCPVPRILVPLDGSSHAYGAVEEAAVLARFHAASVTNVLLVRVVNVGAHPDVSMERQEQEAEQILARGRQILLDAGVEDRKVSVIVEYGKPASVIPQVAEERDANIVIMGRRGRSAVKDLLMGGVSTTVLNRCTGPTVAIVGSRTV